MSDPTTVDLTESRAVEINVVAWVFTGIAIVTVVLKLFARSQITKQLGWDDFFIFFSLVGTCFVSFGRTDLDMLT